MDYTYKFNKYYLPLLNVVETIYLNTTFYIIFKFLLQKQIKDFIQFLKSLQILYKQLNLKDLKIIVTNQNFTLMVAIYNIFPHKKTLLYLQHINKYRKVEQNPIFQNIDKPKNKWQIFYNR